MEIDPRFITLAMLLILFGATVFPVAIDIPVSVYTQDFYDTMEALPDGAVVYAVIQYSPYDMAAPVTSCLKYMKARGFKVIVYSSPVIGQELYMYAAIEEVYGSPMDAAPEYGVSLVNLGYIPGGAYLYEMHKTDLWGYRDTDAFGNTLADMPIVQEVKNVVDDVDLLLSIEDRGGLHSAFVIPYGMTELGIYRTAGFSYAGGWYTAGFIQGLLVGQKGGAEFELLTGVPGIGASFLFTQTSVAAFILLVYVFANVRYFISKPEKVDVGAMEAK